MNKVKHEKKGCINPHIMNVPTMIKVLTPLIVFCGCITFINGVMVNIHRISKIQPPKNSLMSKQKTDF